MVLISHGTVFLPVAATSDIGSPCSYDIKPKTEKIANPATKLDPPFNRHRTNVSLRKQKDIQQMMND